MSAMSLSAAAFPRIQLHAAAGAAAKDHFLVPVHPPPHNNHHHGRPLQFPDDAVIDSTASNSSNSSSGASSGASSTGGSPPPAGDIVTMAHARSVRHASDSSDGGHRDRAEAAVVVPRKAADWERVKPLIEDLYLHNNVRLKDVIVIMHQEHLFRAT